MASNKVPGSIIGMTIGGVWYRCQTDATLTLTVNVAEEDPCKPDEGDVETVGDVPWVERTAESRDWEMSFSANLMRNSLEVENPDIAKLIVDGDVDAEVQFLTRANQTKSDVDFVYAGSGIITGFTLNAPVTGSATTESTITGNGPLTYTKVPVEPETT